ncbi:hypothetical protein HK100_003760, partial [Physocladia obscura]
MTAIVLNASSPSIIVVEESIHQDPEWYHYAGIVLALTSGLFIGSSFIFKKKGLLQTKSLYGDLGDGHQYLKNPLWWTGM